MPSVTMASVSAVNFRQFLTTLLNSVSSVTIWSLGETMLVPALEDDYNYLNEL